MHDRKERQRGKALPLPASVVKPDRPLKQYYVEKIVERRLPNARLGWKWEYKIKWDGYPDTSDQWVKISAFDADRHMP